MSRNVALALIGAALYYLLFVRQVRTARELGGVDLPISLVGGVTLNTPLVPSGPARGRRHPISHTQLIA